MNPSSGIWSVGSIIGIPTIWGVGGLLIIYKSYSLINDLNAMFAKAIHSDNYHSNFGEEEAKNKMAAVVSQAGGSAYGAYHKMNMGRNRPTRGDAPSIAKV